MSHPPSTLSAARASVVTWQVTKDFTYGAKVPCTSVYVDKEFIAKHSANTLRQFIGRVARTGLAPFGVAQAPRLYHTYVNRETTTHIAIYGL